MSEAPNQPKEWNVVKQFYEKYPEGKGKYPKILKNKDPENFGRFLDNHHSEKH
jgi:hypothetical protein